jgi:hypothetical protein
MKDYETYDKRYSEPSDIVGNQRIPIPRPQRTNNKVQQKYGNQAAGKLFMQTGDRKKKSSLSSENEDVHICTAFKLH